ncbi:uncharacterized protein LOC118746947 [Rhagoletis pomonella]|uniref:uncharacterized protein LOC118746947 n=1 Tax=Rhagoletis pomonella TaxID=28610 RepID=UPI001783BD6F|nr:uncharacterized protein LOC118746947 [Rhagoletis pomonella]
MSEDLRNISLPYQLYLYNEELRHASPRKHIVRRIKSKADLTSTLIQENIKHLDDYGVEDLRTINRQVDFKEELAIKAELIQENCIRRKSENIPSTWL